MFSYVAMTEVKSIYNKMYCRRVSKMAITEKESLEVGIKIATEALTNIRTVASLSMCYNRIAKWNENH